jgi:hypothetical protein
LFSSNNSRLYLPGFQPPFIFAASNLFLFAVIFRIPGKTAAGKNKSYCVIDIFKLLVAKIKIIRQITGHRFE